MPCVVTSNGASEKVLLHGNGIAVTEDGSGMPLAKAILDILDANATFDPAAIRQSG